MRPKRRMPPDVRHRIMASIKKHDTVPELALRSALWSAGVKGWRCHAKVTGTPDIAFKRWRVAVFVDGVWWHGHPDYLPKGRRGPYWDEKIARNRVRDRSVNKVLRQMGWKVIRIWDLDVISDPRGACERVVHALRAAGWPRGSKLLPPPTMVSTNPWVKPVAFGKLVAEPTTSAWPSAKHGLEH